MFVNDYRLFFSQLVPIARETDVTCLFRQPVNKRLQNETDIFFHNPDLYANFLQAERKTTNGISE
jgi:hypothetical protein